MDQEIDAIRAEIKKLTRLTEENTITLKYLKRRAQWSSIFSFIKWIIIIGLAIGSFYYIQPFLDQIAAIYHSITGSKIDFMNIFKSIH